MNHFELKLSFEFCIIDNCLLNELLIKTYILYLKTKMVNRGVCAV